MIDHEIAAQLFETRRQFDKMRRRQHQLDMPPQSPETLSVSLQLREREASWLRWNEPHAARSGTIEVVKLSIGYLGRNDDDHSGRDAHFSGRIQLPSETRFALDDVRAAHEWLESGSASGKAVLVV